MNPTSDNSIITNLNPSDKSIPIPNPVSRKSLLLKVLLVVTVLAMSIVGWMLFEYKSYLDESREANAKQAEQINTTLPVVNRYVEKIDSILANPDLSEERRADMLLTKGFILVAVRSSSDIRTSIENANSVFTQLLVYSADKPALKEYKEKALYGYIYNYIVNCFSVNAIKFVPELYTTRYVNSTEVVTPKKYQQQTFRTMIDVANNEFKSLENDKVFLSTRAFLVAAYLSSYIEEMEVSEKNELMAKMYSDMEKQKDLETTIFKDEIRSKILPEFHYAVAYDIYYSNLNKSLTQDFNNMIDENYNNVRNKLTTSGSGDKVSLGMIGILNDTYHIASIGKRYSTEYATNSHYNVVFNSLKTNIFSAPEVSDVTKGFYNFGLTERGAWYKMKTHLFVLAKNDPNLMTLMESIGVNVQSIPK